MLIIPRKLTSKLLKIGNTKTHQTYCNEFGREETPNQEKEEFIHTLVNFDDNCGGFYSYQAYFFAAEALKYFPECSIGNAIIEQLLKWSYVYCGWQIFPQPLVKAARNTLKVTDRKRVIEAFEELLRNTTSRLTLQYAAVRLGEFDKGNKLASAALISLLEVTQNESLAIKRLLNEIKKYKYDFADENQEYYYYLLKNINSINRNHYFYPKIISALKQHMSKEFYQKNSEHYLEVYKFMWNCAKNTSHQDFLTAWNN